MSRENLSSGSPTRSDTNQALRLQKRARSIKFWIKIKKQGGMYYLYVEKIKLLIRLDDRLRNLGYEHISFCRFSHAVTLQIARNAEM